MSIKIIYGGEGGEEKIKSINSVKISAKSVTEIKCWLFEFAQVFKSYS